KSTSGWRKKKAGQVLLCRGLASCAGYKKAPVHVSKRYTSCNIHREDYPLPHRASMALNYKPVKLCSLKKTLPDTAFRVIKAVPPKVDPLLRRVSSSTCAHRSALSKSQRKMAVALERPVVSL
ncbi:hypothetical protein Ciccas_004666, partial [Cichlidogyrus casuarinus]